MVAVRYLSSEDVADLAAPADFVDAVREGYRQRGNGAPAEPRTTLRADTVPGMLTSYLTILPETGYMGGYTYAAGFEEADAWFITPLFDASTGALVALIDGAAMNPFKTGAAGAVGIDVLARDDAETLGVIGSGSQAWGQVITAVTVRDIDEVLVYSPTVDNRESFAAALTEALPISVHPVDNPSELVHRSDIVVTATTSGEPVFDGELLEPGTHITAMGQYHPERHEIDATTIQRSTYVLDLRARADRDAGAFLHAVSSGAVDTDHVSAELGEIVAGHVPGRTDSDEITLFDSGGTAIETVSSAAMLLERALDCERGTVLDLSPASQAFPGPPSEEQSR